MDSPMGERNNEIVGGTASTPETNTETATGVKNIEIEEIIAKKKNLFNMAMIGKWDNVVEICTETPELHKSQITRSGDTALHLAVSAGQEDIVGQLVRLICHPVEADSTPAESKPEQSEEKKVPVSPLGVSNVRGNTPLHIAASMGSKTMCECIASVDSSLVGARNHDGETPLFLAALHGRKDAFLCLRDVVIPEPESDINVYEYFRREDGETILHRAIAGDYFDLAFQIIGLYPDLVNSVNGHGFTPLHVLANKPSAFKSSCHLERWDKILYRCTIVDELEIQSDQQSTENYQTWEKNRRKQRDEENPRAGTQGSEATNGAEKHLCTFLKFVKLAINAFLLVIHGSTGMKIKLCQKVKVNHLWALKILDKLVEKSTMYTSDGLPENQMQEETSNSLKTIKNTNNEGDGQTNTSTAAKIGINEIHGRTPILIAAENGITEIVKKILKRFPVAIHDSDEKKKNIVLLAVEHRQLEVCKLLLEKYIEKEHVFQQVDEHGNSALHLAAQVGQHKPLSIPGAALQMQWEIKWYEYVKTNMPLNFFAQNDNDETSTDIFNSTHMNLVKEGGEWLKSTSNSCSVVAGLISAVAFATSATVPGGVEHGSPVLEKHTPFTIFAIASLVALCFSITALVLFLSILTSRCDEREFGKSLPTKLLLGLTSLFVSIASVLISFCAGHFFLLEEKLKQMAFPLYAVTCLPVTLYAIAQLPLYVDLVWANCTKVPQRSYMLKSAPTLRKTNEVTKAVSERQSRKQQSRPRPCFCGMAKFNE